jgi:hypothetical protein
MPICQFAAAACREPVDLATKKKAPQRLSETNTGGAFMKGMDHQFNGRG